MPKRITKLERELALALDVASRLNINPNGAIKTGNAVLWANPSPFQEKINELLVKAGRQPIAPNTAYTGIAAGSTKPALAASDNQSVAEAGSPALR
jgi:hypothetical protein